MFSSLRGIIVFRNLGFRGLRNLLLTFQTREDLPRPIAGMSVPRHWMIFFPQ